jgi:hypothetical protein
MKSRRLRSFLLLLFGLSACQHPRPPLVLITEGGAVKLAVDSVQLPELAHFPLRLTLANYSRHKVVLVFDSLATDYPRATTHRPAKNFYLVARQDTFLLSASTSDHCLIFRERRATSFLCNGYFRWGKGSFTSFEQLRTVFKNAQVVYAMPSPMGRRVDVAAATSAGDTLLLPMKLAVPTAPAVVGYGFPQAFYKRREARLTLPEQSN